VLYGELYVGAPGWDGADGTVYVLDLQPEPEVVAAIRGPETSRQFGYALATKSTRFLSPAVASYVVVSDPYEDAVFVYVREWYTPRDAFELTQVLTPPLPDDGGSFFFGEALALSNKSPVLAVQQRNGGATYVYRSYDNGAHWAPPAALVPSDRADNGSGVVFTGDSDDHLVAVAANRSATTTSIYQRDDDLSDWSLSQTLREPRVSSTFAEADEGVFDYPKKNAVAASEMDLVVASDEGEAYAYSFETCAALEVAHKQGWLDDDDDAQNGPTNGSYVVSARAHGFFDDGRLSVSATFPEPVVVEEGETGLALHKRTCLRDGCYVLDVPNATAYDWRYGNVVGLTNFWVRAGEIVRTDASCSHDFFDFVDRPTAFPTITHTAFPTITHTDAHSSSGKKKKKKSGLSSAAVAGVVVACGFFVIVGGVVFSVLVKAKHHSKPFVPRESKVSGDIEMEDSSSESK